MKLLSTSILAATLFAGLAVAGCETSHTESTKPTWTGGEKHEETTTYKNPVTGDVSTEHKEQRTN